MLGIRGLPLFGPAYALLLALGLVCDDDADCAKQKAMETSARLDHFAHKVAGDGLLGDTLSGGLFYAILHMDISSRAGLSNIFSVMPFDDDYLTDLFKDQDHYYEGLVKLLFGAAGGMGANFARGIDLMSSSDAGAYNWWKGLAYMAPAGARNLIYTYLWATDGVKTRSYMTLLDKRELNAFDLMMRAAGFQPKKTSEVYRANSTRTVLSRALAAESASIKREFYYAYTRGDRDAVRQLERRWLEYRRLRVKLGMPLKDANGSLASYVHRKIKDTARTRRQNALMR